MDSISLANKVKILPFDDFKPSSLEHWYDNCHLTEAGIKEKALDENGNVIVACDKAYYRPLEVNNLLGDAKKARKILKWSPKTNINDLISEMLEIEMNKLTSYIN